MTEENFKRTLAATGIDLSQELLLLLRAYFPKADCRKAAETEIPID